MICFGSFVLLFREQVFPFAARMGVFVIASTGFCLIVVSMNKFYAELC